MYFVYVLENSERRRYTKSTNNIQERLRMYTSRDKETARFHKTTFGKGPRNILYSKSFKTRKEAL